jgi:hypothetical protein
MSDERIIIPESEEQGPQEEELKYKATESDEKNFFLMYHLHWPPSEVANLDPDYREWLIARFIGQKGMEREAMEQHRLMNAIGPNLKV